eukprot:TRINITY_DN62623_c0_g1_i1.p1 TRINITY_DN62623_c0_g1~~TRINITY_DN62623_c0_g1_i1.p1  ORF type:complete len:372 (+),score=58.69 TRINITY_DN62623_c0_g1_i1:83-1198(+)
MPDLLSASLSRQEFNASLTRPKLDATLVLDSTHEDPPKQHGLFALASLNTRTAPSAEVCWSQLLALSLKPESEPVLSVGRHKDCWVRVSDPRVSVNHFDIVARKAVLEDGTLGVEQLGYQCFLNDRSSNGTAVNGNVVGKGNSAQLHTGDEICVLPASRVGQDEMISFVFRNTTESLSTPEGVEMLALELEELIVCPICMQAIYKCVALTPCSHNFCMACCSDWMRRKSDCPVCRRPITAVMKNHPMDSVVEAFLAAQPNRRRSMLELRDMDARDELRLGASGKLVRDVCTVTPGGAAAGGGSPARPARTPTGATQGRPGSAARERGSNVADSAAASTASAATPSRVGTGGASSGSNLESRSLGSQVCSIQ